MARPVLLPAMLALTMLTGCPQPDSRPVAPSEIENADAARRALAVRQAAVRNDAEAVPLLVDRLEDEDSSVRFYAILALERLTGDRMGYVYYRPPERQKEAIERWRQFARARGAATQPTFAAMDTASLQPPPASQP